MPSKRQEELLPPGWKVSANIQKKAGGYYLNNVETLRKLKDNADRKTHIEPEIKKDNSVSLCFSTGAYMETVVTLLEFWKEKEGTGLFNFEDTDGMN